MQDGFWDVELLGLVVGFYCFDVGAFDQGGNYNCGVNLSIKQDPRITLFNQKVQNLRLIALPNIPKNRQDLFLKPTGIIQFHLQIHKAFFQKSLRNLLKFQKSKRKSLHNESQQLEDIYIFYFILYADPIEEADAVPELYYLGVFGFEV